MLIGLDGRICVRSCKQIGAGVIAGTGNNEGHCVCDTENDYILDEEGCAQVQKPPPIICAKGWGRSKEDSTRQ